MAGLQGDKKISNIPVIMLSAKGETFDKVLGLELGAAWKQKNRRSKNHLSRTYNRNQKNDSH